MCVKEVKVMRHWKPLSGAVELCLSPDGYTLAELAEKRCLVLIGEPGIGKTTCVQQYVRGETKHHCHCIDLRSVTTDVGLKEKIRNNEEIRKWRQGNYELELFLDSLDECRLRIGNIVDVLIDVLGRMPLDRLKLRLVCRTSEWSSYMHDRLEKLWRGHLGSEEDADGIVSVYEMLPLQENDIRKFAKRRGVDPVRFWAEVKSRGVEPFARNPVTLQFLLNPFQERGSLTGVTRKALFKEGYERPCVEPGKTRRASRKTGNLALPQHLATPIVWKTSDHQGILCLGLAVKRTSTSPFLHSGAYRYVLHTCDNMCRISVKYSVGPHEVNKDGYRNPDNLACFLLSRSRAFQRHSLC